jgi:hypothetical protein
VSLSSICNGYSRLNPIARKQGYTLPLTYVEKRFAEMMMGPYNEPTKPMRTPNRRHKEGALVAD